jgi:hypothetical protein
MAIRWCGIAAITGASCDARTIVATFAATFALALAAAAPAATARKVVHFTATSTVHNSGGASFAGTFQSRQLGCGTVRYTGKPAGDASVTRWRARLRSGATSW